MADRPVTPTYQGIVKEWKPRRRALPSLYVKHAMLGDFIGYTTDLKVWVNGVSIEYPDPSVHLGLSNGKGRTYATTTTDELRQLGNNLLGWANEIDEVVSKCEPERQTTNNFLEKYTAQIAALRQQMQAAGIDPAALQEPPYEPAPVTYPDNGFDEEYEP